MEHDLKEIVKEFGAFIVKKLSITKPFKIQLTGNREGMKTYAHYDPKAGIVKVCIKGRSKADILRSIAHEMVHHQQNQNGKLDPKTPIPDIGGEIEDEANAVAGQLIKEFSYAHKEFELYD